MRITFSLNNSDYDCRLFITDSRGRRELYIFAPNEKMNVSSTYIGIEVYDGDFDIMAIPITPRADDLTDKKEMGFFEKAAFKTAAKVISKMMNIILRVSCQYRVSGALDGDCIDLNYRTYVHGCKALNDNLELIPMVYAFFEAEDKNGRLKPTRAYGSNRREVIRMARRWTLFDSIGLGSFGFLLTYPIQLGRIKYLSKGKRVLKKINKLNCMGEDERRRFFKEQEEYFK